MSNKQKHSDNPKDVVETNQISEWVEEIRKDLENSSFAKNRNSENEFNPVISDKKKDPLISNENYVMDQKKEDNNFLCKGEIKKEEFDVLHKENERNKLIECRFYDGKRMCDTAEIFRRKEIAHKKEANDIDYKLKEIDKRKDNDIIDNSRHRYSGERKKEYPDRERNKERMSTDFITDHIRQKEWLEEKFLDRKPELEKSRKINRDLDTSEKEICDSIINNKEDSERYEKKSNDSLEQHEEEIIRRNEFLKKEKKKERLNSWPAAIGCKRRLSSQDSLDVCGDDSKKSKPERRDSKDSGRSSSSSKKSSSEKHNKSFTKLLEEKIKEDKERELNKKRKDDDLSADSLKLAAKKDRKVCGEKKKIIEGSDRKGKVRHKENGITASESETGSGDDGSKTPKKHSIFDIVDEEPAYISMYDKVKARSTKNMQKQEEEKRQERLKEKFNLLKQSRAKREEKKRSTSYDEDSDSERGGRRSNKLLITSSEEDAGSENDMRTKGRKIMSDTSEDDIHRHSNPTRIKPLRIMSSEDIESKQRKIMSDTSEDDTRRLSINRFNADRAHQEELQPKIRKILSDTSEDDVMKHCIPRNKTTRIQSDESEIDLGYDDQKKDDDFIKKTNDYATSDLFSNISEDPEHPTHTDIEREQTEQYHRNSIDSSTSDIPRKKSHKKKQKRQKNNEDSEEGSSSKRHISKKDRRKSSHSHDGEEDQSIQTKNKKKKNDISKRDEKMEDIFGPLSDDSDKTRSKWHLSKVYGSDSDEERQVIRKRDKKRKERRARELDEAGRALEAKLLNDSENYPPSEEFTKTKKKKRKKSREEKSSKHHQQRLEEEAAAQANEADSEREPDPVIPPPPFPRLMESPPPCISQNKKPDIPGFGSQVDENIHETAVKSISESPTKPVEEKREPVEEPVPSSTSEDKPTPVISQEETEDAVAALLMEDSFGGGFEGYTKPDTPVSEPDLQIDTDTEDTFDPIDFSKPPRTPDIPTSFYRQQDTREGLEERILALACPDNSSSKNDNETSNEKSPPSINITEYHQNDKERKTTDNCKDENSASVDTCNKDEKPVNIDDPKVSTVEKPNIPAEAGKRHDLPPLVCQTDISHVQPVKTNYSDLKSQVKPEQGLQKVTVAKVVNSERLPLASCTPIQTKVLPSLDPPPLVQTINHASSQPSKPPGEIHNIPVSSSLTPAQTDGSRNTHIVQSQLSNPSVFSTSQVESHKNRLLHVNPIVHEANSDKTSLKPVSANQIIVTPTTPVALLVQSQTKLHQSDQQNNSVLQLSPKLHSPGNQQLEIKANAQVSQYVLHHTLQSSQILGPQPIVNKVPNQQSVPIGQVSQGQPIQGCHKISLPAMPSSAKSPGIPVSTKTTVQSCMLDQKYKQVVLNHPHNQQLSVNVSHSHQLNTNVLLSPSHQVNTSHSPTPLSFSPHHIKVSMPHQQTNNVHPSTMQHSPNIHHQQISPLGHQQKIGQHSPTVQQPHIGHQTAHSIQHQNKCNSPVLQQVPNCISNVPLKLCSPTNPGTVQTIRHLSPVSQSNTTNKINSHILQTGVQQVRTVVLQNPVKQTVTVLQPQMVQRPLCTPMIRPLNAPQPGVVHTLKNDPPSIDKNKNPTETLLAPHTLKNDFTASKLLQPPSEEPISLTTPKIHQKSSEEPISITVPKEENEPETEKHNSSENIVEPAKTCHIENRPLKSSVEDIKPLNAVIQDLTYKAAQAAICVNNQTEGEKSNLSKPLDQVVQEIHDRKKAAEPKETANSEEKDEPSEIDNHNTKVNIKPDFVLESVGIEEDTEPKNLSDHDNYCNIKEESKETKCNIENIRPLVEDMKQEKDNSLEQTGEVVSPIGEPKVEKIRIKKEENGLCIDSASWPEKEDVASKQDDLKTQIDECLTKTNTSNEETSAEDTEEHKNEQVVESREEVPAVSGRGRGRRRKAGGRVGGVVTRRARLNNSTTSSNDMVSADVYEFRDDSEEEANRPRLILTIKSPPDPAPCPNNNNSASTRKSRRLQAKDGSRTTVDDTIEDVIRGTRSGRRATRATGNCPVVTPAMETRKSPRRKQSATSAPSLPTASATSEMETTCTEMEGEVTEPTPPPASSPQPAAVPTQTPTEPMTLIDPVTGLLIPMQESEEGQYIPVNADQVRPAPASIESKEDVGEPVEKRMRISEAEMCLPTRPGIPVKVPPNCAVVPPLPPKTTPKPIVMSSELPRPIIAHSKPPGVTKTTGIVVPSGIPRPNTALPNPVALTKPLTIAAPTSLVKAVMMSPTGVSKASLTNVVGPMTINRVVAPPPVSPSAKPIPHGSPINHKAHLLQAVAQRNKVPVAKIPTPMTPKVHLLQTMNNAVVREGMVGPGTPPPIHHGALLTGSVASPPLRAPHHTSQQPVVTGASSARVVCKGLLEPVKVEPGGCIVVPTASPQSRSQVMQAGLPVPAYEASLGDVVQHVNYPHHIQPAHYVHSQLVYQQYLREAALTSGYHMPAGGVVKGVKSELEEGVKVAGGSPPLELRRGSPHDRATDSPQVATVYVHGPRHLYYEPPPAHRPAQPRLQVSTPPHASQVPPQADSLLMLLQRYPVMWQGLLALKTDQAAVQMHFVFGNPNVARDSLPCNLDGSTPPLRIAQRMRLEQTQLEGVARKMQTDNEHCMLLALPCGRDHMDVLQQSNNLQSGFITYLQQKQAAGIINIAGPGSQQAAYVVHIFPSCEFANESLTRIAPDLLHRVANIAHLLIVIATV